MAESKTDIADAANGVTVTAPDSIEVAKAEAENPVMFDLSDIVVKAGDTTLRYGVDYVISYENNTDFGTAKLVIKGIDGYTGTLEHEFTITQKAKVMTGITWNTKPEKVIYTEGETLDVTGLVFNVVYVMIQPRQWHTVKQMQMNLHSALHWIQNLLPQTKR